MFHAPRLALSAALAVAAVCASSCAPRPMYSYSPSTTSTTQTTAATQTTSASTADAAAFDASALEVGIAIADEIRRSCDLPHDPEDLPHFEFDFARLSPRGATIVDAVGSCLTAGGLAMRRVRIIGHTDSRGPRRYNEELGLARALAAKMELERVGVPSANVEVESRGAADARGSDDASRALDRRIEIQLAP